MQGDIDAAAGVPLPALRGTDWHNACGNCGNSRQHRKREGGLGKLLVHQLQRLGGEGAHICDPSFRAGAAYCSSTPGGYKLSD